MMLLVTVCAASSAPGASVGIDCAEATVLMGDAAVIEARVTAPEGAELAEGLQLLPFVDGKRWGHHATLDTGGGGVGWGWGYTA